MFKKIKHKLKKMNNRGSSFILVIVSVTFLSILISALLLGVLLAYRLKFYKLNSLNNFYSVEKAMDEIYAGIGSSTNEHLYTAYTTTAELVVTYDTKHQVYVNMDNDEANKIFKQFFMEGMYNDEQFAGVEQLQVTLSKYITDPDVTLNCDNMGIYYIDGNGEYRFEKYESNGGVLSKKTGYKSSTTAFNEKNIQKIIFKNICVDRTIEINAKNDKETMAGGIYNQSITTDIVLTEPEYNVAFDMVNANGDSLYNYAVLADMGLQVDPSNEGTDVSIKGNVYTASDYYNKDYNADSKSKVTNKYNELASYWGDTNESIYSGIYASGDNTTLSLNSDVLINSGSLSVFDGASVNLSGRSVLLSELWTDNIVIGGTEGGSLNMAANAYVYDDTELNAEESRLTFSKGTYFGYSYTADDVRSINLLKGVAIGDTKANSKLNSNFSLRSHFSDSAILVNGKNSTLDLQHLDSLYVAGKSYIEFSKTAASTVSDGDGTYIADTDADAAYSVDFEDISTGQSIDVKSNQLIYLAQWSLDDEDSIPKDGDGKPIPGTYEVEMKLPASFGSNATIQALYQDLLFELNTRNHTTKDTYTVIYQSNVSGHSYAYLLIPEDLAEEFAEKYYDFLHNYGDQITNQLYNVVQYVDFPVKVYMPNDTQTGIDNSKVKTVAGATYGTVDGATDNLLYMNASADTTLNVDTALKSASTSKTFTLLLGNLGADDTNNVYEGLKTNSAEFNGRVGDTYTPNNEEAVSNFLTYMYINMKDHLTVVDKLEGDDGSEDEVSAWELAGYTDTANGFEYAYNTLTKSYSYDYSITPLTNFVDYDYLFANDVQINETFDNSKIIINKGDVEIKADTADGSVQGIIVAGGNVTFDENVKSFRGLIISGAKLTIDHDITISSDATFVTSLLNECSENTNKNINCITTYILKNYSATKDKNSAQVTGASISDISYQDILIFENWKKNVE